MSGNINNIPAAHVSIFYSSSTILFNLLILFFLLPVAHQHVIRKEKCMEIASTYSEIFYQHGLTL